MVETNSQDVLYGSLSDAPDSQINGWEIVGIFLGALLACLVISVTIWKTIEITLLDKSVATFGASSLSVLNAALSVGATIGALAATFVVVNKAYFSHKFSSDQVRRNFTYELLKEWRSRDIVSARIKVLHYFKGKYDTSKLDGIKLYHTLLLHLYHKGGKIDSERGEDIKAVSIIELENLRELEVSVMLLLNYFEAVSVAYEKGDVNKAIIEHYFAIGLTKWYDILIGYILMSQLWHRGEVETETNIDMLDSPYSKLFSDPDSTQSAYSTFVRLVKTWRGK